MNGLIISKETVIQTLNLIPSFSFNLGFEEDTAIRTFLYGTPTDEQQIIVLAICKAIVDSRDEWDVKNGNNLS
jgi:hypothetical protein